ncbi:MAG TPA: molybdopterin molybdotransferase MoeA [Steroidobacteraceae bacterium]|nr:molybdopterin molybdotransferase MoeA [Steroidobacteraceae bacterium]
MTRQRPAPLTPQQAQAAIDTRLIALPPEVRPLEQCIGQTLREDVYAERDNPPFDRVCMDGIAVDSGAIGRGIRRLALEAMQPAGAPALTLSNREHAIEVMTGAILPRGTDSVIPLEEYDVADGFVTLKANAAGTPYRNVQRRGADSQPGVPMLCSGIRLGAPEIAVAASAGLARVKVSRQPDIVVISTGDELIDPGQPIAEYQVRRSNVYALVAALRDHGLDRIANDHVRDDERELSERLGQHLAARDVLILSGGVSRGRFDLVPGVLKSLGVGEVFHQVAQRPGMPMWFGVGARGQAVFGLPGNPVSTLLCLVRYVVPALLRAMGGTLAAPEPIALASSIKLGRSDTSFLPVSVQYDARGQAQAVARPTRGSGDFLALAGTRGFIELPPRLEEFPAGYVASLYRW